MLRDHVCMYLSDQKGVNILKGNSSTVIMVIVDILAYQVIHVAWQHHLTTICYFGVSGHPCGMTAPPDDNLLFWHIRSSMWHDSTTWRQFVILAFGISGHPCGMTAIPDDNLLFYQLLSYTQYAYKSHTAIPVLHKHHEQDECYAIAKY